MKNLKKLLLLGVMLVNVMPYLKDGKVEWKAAQAEAQTYTCESSLVERLFGIYKCVNIQDENDMFYGDDTRCLLTAGKCICPLCQHLYNCSDKCTRSSCPASSGGDGIKINYEMDINKNISSPSSKWCSFCVLTAIKPPASSNNTNTGSSQTIGSSGSSGLDPSIYAKDYFKNVRNPKITEESEMLDHGIFDTDLQSFYGSNGVSCGSSISNPTELIEKMKGNHGLVVVSPLDNNEGHVMLIYKLHKDDDDPEEKAKATFYDPLGKVSNYTLDKLPLSTYIMNFIVK
jgi:hypothetical protein